MPWNSVANRLGIHKVPFSRKVLKRRILIRIMFASSLFVLLFVQLWLDVALGYPVSIRRDPYVLKPITWDSIRDQRNWVDQLINSPANKDVFTKLKFSDAAYYDLDSNTVGTAANPVYNQYQRQPYVANGFIGSRIPNLGQGFTYDQLSDDPEAVEDDLSNGWPLFNKRYAGAFIAGFFNIQKNTTGTNFPELLDLGYESVIAAVPQWTSLSISTTWEGKMFTLDPSLSPESIGEITNYAQNLSLSDGIVTTEFTWLETIQVKYEVLAHRQEINLGIVNLEIVNLGNTTFDLTIEDNLDFQTAQRSQLTSVDSDDSGIYITFQPNELDYVNGAIYSTLQVPKGSTTKSKSNDTVSQSVTLSASQNDVLHLTKFVGIVTSDYDELLDSGEKVMQFAKQVSNSQSDVHKLIDSHKAAWAQTLESSPAVTFANDLLLTLATRSSIYHLAANTRPDAQGVTGALSVGGLSSDSYAGMVFWDADLWMLGGMLPVLPSHAKSIVNYRVHTHEQAMKNVPEGHEGAAYPWTSGRFGNCTATGPCIDYEYHINMAVAYGAWELYLSGGADEEFLESVAYPLITDAATFFSDYLVHYNESMGIYTTHNLTDPDEFANHVDNGAYTNAGISLVMKWAIAVANHLGKPVPAEFTKIVGNVELPSSNDITLEYTGMNASVGIKQADVIMLTYPLDNEMISEAEAYKNMEFYSMKQVSYGPAMTFPIFSIVASNLSPAGCASQSYLRKAVQPFLRGPFAQFSEQNNDNYVTNGGTHPAFPFMTAHGGFLQAVIQGLTGLRYGYEIENDKLSRVLTLDPIALPCLGNGVIYEGLKYNNHSLSLAINETAFTVKNNGKLDDSADDFIKISLAARNDMNGTYTLNDNDEMVFPLFTPKQSFESSVSECGNATFTNITSGAYGDAAILINDGDITTHWQAQYNDTTSKILVDLKEYKHLTHGLVVWGDKPAKKWRLLAFNNTYDLQNTTDFLSKVDFGVDLHNIYSYGNPDGVVYQQSDVFHTVLDQNVDISAEYNEEEYMTIDVPGMRNTTNFELEGGLLARFLLIEAEGIHDTEAIDEDYGGSKFYEVVLY